MRDSLSQRKWKTVKLPSDLIKVVDKHINTPVDGVLLYDSRTAFIRSVLHDYFGRIRAEKGSFIKQEETIRAK